MVRTHKLKPITTTIYLRLIVPQAFHKYLTYSTSFNSHSNPMRLLILPLFYR